MLWLIYKILTRLPGPGLGCHTGRSFCFCEINIVSPARWPGAGGPAPHRQPQWKNLFTMLLSLI